MSAETWELIEYRLWHKVGTRVWALLGAFLTIVSVLGLLGIPAYIRDQFRDNINKETERFAALRASMRQEWQDVYARNIVLARELAALTRAKEVLERYSVRSEQKVGSSDTYEFGSGDVPSVKVQEWIARMRSGLMTEDEYLSMIRQAPALREFGLRAKVPQSSKDLVEPLDRLAEIFPHVAALSKSIDGYLGQMVTLEKGDETRKAILTREYERRFYPIYKQSLKPYRTVYSMRAGEDWATPIPNAGFEFTGLAPLLPDDVK